MDDATQRLAVNQCVFDATCPHPARRQGHCDTHYSYAHKHGGLAVIDELAIEIAVSGRPGLRLNRAEMRAAWQALEARGLDTRQIAARLGVNVRSVQRWRRGDTAPASSPALRRGAA